MLKNPHFIIFAKAPKTQYESFMTKFAEKMSTSFSKDKGSPKITEPFNKEYHRDHYIKLCKIANFGLIVSYLFLSSFNSQTAYMTIKNNEIHLKKKSITRAMKINQYKFLKDRIKVFDLSKFKSFSKASPSQKEKYKTQAGYDKAINEKLQKKLGMLV